MEAFGLGRRKMKSVALKQQNHHRLRFLLRRPALQLQQQSFSSIPTLSTLFPPCCCGENETVKKPSSISNPNSTKQVRLTPQELTKINLLIPRLCLSGNLSTAIHLTTTSFLANPPPPPPSLSLSILLHSLTSHPDMSNTMSLLTILRHTTPSHPHLSAITTMLLSSYLSKSRPKEALKVYHWMLRPGSPCSPDKTAYGVLVSGLCRCGLLLEALRVLRDMSDVGFLPGVGLRERVYRSLLREARVREALELDKAFCGGNANGKQKLIDLLDSTIGNWTD